MPKQPRHTDREQDGDALHEEIEGMFRVKSVNGARGYVSMEAAPVKIKCARCGRMFEVTGDRRCPECGCAYNWER